MKAMITKEEALADRAMTLVEDALLDARDDDVLASGRAREVARDARTVIEEVIRRARLTALPRAREPRRAGGGPARRQQPRRTIMRDLLVASARARDIMGKAGVDEMSDGEIDAALEKLAALGIVPDEKK